MWCSLFIRFLNLPPGRNCLPGWCFFIRFPNLPSGDCRQGVKPDLTCSEPTSRGQSAGSASSFMASKSFSRGLSAGGGGYKLFISLGTYFQRSKSVVQSVYKISEPTCRELSAWMEHLYMVSEPTSKGLLAESAA